jgi:uncharacterized membrane protein YgcG
MKTSIPRPRAKLADMSCPACGFHVFNRRYPKCERCKSDLPASLVYSDQERRALLEQEKERLGVELQHREREREREARHRRSAPGIAGGEVAAPTAPHGGGSGSGSGGFVSGGGGVFDGAGASGSYGGDGGSCSGSD